MSVAPLFELAHADYDVRADGYDYERCRTSEHLLEAVRRHARKAEVIYIGLHGSKAGLELSGKSIPVADIVETISALGNKSKVAGIYLSACELGTEALAKSILTVLPNLKWVAGYGASVDWISSSALDMLFFNRWLQLESGSLAKVRAVAKSLSADVGALARKRAVRFGLYVRGRDGNVTNLLGNA